MPDKDLLQLTIIGDFLSYELPTELAEGNLKTTHLRARIDDLVEPFSVEPDVIIFLADEATTIPPLEAGQCLRANYPEKPILYVTIDKVTFEKKKLIKNGFSSAFILPWDRFHFLQAIEDLSFLHKNKALKDYVKIQVMDLHPGTVLEFATKIYLPLNNKIHYFSREGEVITEEKIKLLKGDARNTVLIHKEEVAKFYDYCAKQLAAIGGEAVSETERKQKLEASVRDLVSDLFVETSNESTFGKSQQLMKNFREILLSMTKAKDGRLAERLRGMTVDEADFYGHLSSVSCYAGIFAMAAGLPNVDEVGVAGLLHDIGKTNFPFEMVETPFEELTGDQKKTYMQHPQYSIDICNLKRLVIPDKSRTAILQHHERIDGTGYPKGLKGDRISIEAKILAIANKFAHLTNTATGEVHLSPIAALEKLISENSNNPGIQELDRILLLRIFEVLTKASK